MLNLYVKILLDLCNNVCIAGKGLCDDEARRLRHEHTVDMIAVRMLILEDIPSDGEVVRGEVLAVDHHTADAHRFFSGFNYAQHHLVRREAFKRQPRRRCAHECAYTLVDICGSVFSGRC